MGITPLAFTGVSSFSEDFQSILKRSVSIASLPVGLLQTDQQTALDKKTALSELRMEVSGLASSLAGLGELGSGGALKASSSGSAVTATLGSGAAVGSYQISDITSLATSAIATTAGGYASATTTQVSSGTHELELVIDGEETTLTLTAATDNLAGVRDAINKLNLGVTASIIDTGSGDQRYYLSLSSATTGARDFELRTLAGETATDILTMTNAGSDAVFKVNGQTVTSKENFVTGVIAGVNLQLNEATGLGKSLTVTVGEDRSSITEGLSAFVEAYNTLREKLSSHMGEEAGVLAGDMIINDLSSRMRAIAGYRGEGGIADLTALGITMDTSGVMSIDTTTVEWMSGSSLTQVFEFLGDGETGLSALADGLYEWSDPLTGFIVQQMASYDETDARLAEQIEQIQERVNSMQTSMMAKLQAADALLASLESQQSLLTASIDSLNALTNGKNE